MQNHCEKRSLKHFPEIKYCNGSALRALDKEKSRTDPVRACVRLVSAVTLKDPPDRDGCIG